MHVQQSARVSSPTRLGTAIALVVPVMHHHSHTDAANAAPHTTNWNRLAGSNGGRAITHRQPAKVEYRNSKFAYCVKCGAGQTRHTLPGRCVRRGCYGLLSRHKRMELTGHLHMAATDNRVKPFGVSRLQMADVKSPMVNRPEIRGTMALDCPEPVSPQSDSDTAQH